MVKLKLRADFGHGTTARPRQKCPQTAVSTKDVKSRVISFKSVTNNSLASRDVAIFVLDLEVAYISASDKFWKRF